MKRRYQIVGLILSIQLFVSVSPSLAAGEPQRLKIIYSSFTGGYTPLWIAVDEGLGRKYGLDLQAVYAGRARPHQLLLSGDAQYVISTGTGVVSSYAVGQKDLVIIATFGWMTEDDARAWEPKVVFVDERNRPKDRHGAERPGQGDLRQVVWQ